MGNKNKKGFLNISIFKIICFIVLACYAMLFIGLFAYGALSSLKTFSEFIDYPTQLPQELNFENYATVFKFFWNQPKGVTGPTYYIEHMLLFSVLYSVGCALVNLFICAQTAYACARFNFKFSGVVYAIVIFTMIFPVIGSLPSEMQMVKNLNLQDSFIGNYFLKASFVNIYFLVLFVAFKKVPKDFEEAAQLDGASYSMVMFKIMYPMVSNMLLTIFIIYFIQYWNDYQTPNLYLQAYPTLSMGLLHFQFSTRIEIAGEPVKLAAAIMVFIPIFTVFLIFSNRLMGNITMGGVKE